MEESREKREERREKMAASSIHCIFTVSRDYLEKVMKIRGGHENDRQLDSLQILRCPETTSMRAAKVHKSSSDLFRQNSEKQRVLRRGSPARIPAFLQGAVATSSEGKTRPKKASKLRSFFL